MSETIDPDLVSITTGKPFEKMTVNELRSVSNTLAARFYRSGLPEKQLTEFSRINLWWSFRAIEAIDASTPPSAKG